jgi:antitoxin (DNA-binding transcriptional repressor) of toxin-antitoxin stability system
VSESRSVEEGDDYGQEVTMRTMKASEFKARCLKVMDEVAASRQLVVITKNGKAIAKLGPLTEQKRSILGLHKGQIEILGDIISPLDVEWKADR